LTSSTGELQLRHLELAPDDIIEVLSGDEEPESQALEEEDDEVEILPSSFNASQSTSSSATRGGGQPSSSQPSNGSTRKRKLPEFIEGSSNKPYKSQWMLEQEEWMREQ